MRRVIKKEVMAKAKGMLRADPPGRSAFFLIAFLFALFSINSVSAQDLIAEQLAPTGQAAAKAQATPVPEAPEVPELPVEALDPAPHLPGLPGWITALIILVALALLTGIVLLVLRLAGKAKPPLSSERNPLHAAQERLLALRDLPAETPLADLSTQISLILRHYLAASKAEKALYQTREEFVTSEDRLRNLPPAIAEKTTDFLTELSALQYAPPQTNPEQVAGLIERGLTTLDAIATAEPFPPIAH